MRKQFETHGPEVCITLDGQPLIAISVLALILNECDLYAFVSLLRADIVLARTDVNWYLVIGEPPK